MTERISNLKPLFQAVLIYGLGRAGKTLASFLLRKGIKVFAYDDNPMVFQEEDIQRLSKDPNFQPITKRTLPKVDIAICSPGVPTQTNSLVLIKNLLRNRIPIIDEIEFTSQFIKKPIIAITGTNGKSTTTALIAEILIADKRKVFCGGNLAPGQPFSQALSLKQKDYYVVEVSSFQLERCYNFKPKIAILLNITEDHFDRHRSKAEYVALKFRIFAQQDRNDYAIINFDDPVIGDNLSQIHAKTYYFSSQKVVNGAYLRDGIIYFRDEPVLPINQIKLPGEHNLKNVLAAICAAKIIGVKNQSITHAVAQFNGLPHRLELLKEIAGVKYINNSMCTNPEAAINSLNAVKKPVILITGGKEKNLKLTRYLKTIVNQAKYTILIGENRYRLKIALKKLHYHNLKVCQSLNEAVKTAQKKAIRGDTVLFSPGFASFDSFANFIERGEAFRSAVNSIPNS